MPCIAYVFREISLAQRVTKTRPCALITRRSEPSIRGRIAARLSVKRYVRQSLGLKAPRGWGWLTNPRKAAYNRIYNRTTFGVGKGCLIMLVLVVSPIIVLAVVAIRLLCG